MYQQVFIFMLLSVASALCTLETRIINGTDAATNNYPFVVSVQHLHEHVCTGAILNKTQVITSASCVQNLSAKSLTIRKGSPHHATEGSIHYVTKIICNNSYTAAGNVLDIAILEIDGMLFNDGDSVTYSVKAPPKDTPLTMLGWGPTDMDNVNLISSNLRSGTVKKLQSTSVCASLLGKAMVGRTVNCASDIAFTACKGDSGGPLVIGTELYGVISRVRRCGMEPTIFTILSHIDVLDHIKTCNPA